MDTDLHEYRRSNGEDSHAGQWTLHDLAVILRRGKGTIIASTVTILVLVATYTFLAKPVYESTGIIVIDTQSKGGGLNIVDLHGSGITTKIANETETLKSRTIAEAVAKALIGRKYISDSDQRVLEIIKGEDAATGGPPTAPVSSVCNRLSNVIDFTPVKESDVIKITARSTIPEEAALIVNTYIEEYSNRNLSASRAKSHALREFLQSQLEVKHGVLDSTEQQLKTYMSRHGVVSLDDEAKKSVEQLASLEASRDALDMEITSREKTVSSLKAELASQEPNVARAIGQSDDAYVKLLQMQLARLEVERDIATAQSGRTEEVGKGVANDVVRDYDTQIAALKKNLRERTTMLLKSLTPNDQNDPTGNTPTKYLSSIKQKIVEQQIDLDGLWAKRSVLEGSLTEYEHRFNTIPEKSIDLAKLQRARLSSEKLYLLVEEKYNEAAIAERSQFGDVNVVDGAAVSALPVSPRPMLNLAVGLILGLGLGAGIVIVRSSMDTRLRTPADFKRRGIAPLAVILKMNTKKGRIYPSDMAHTRIGRIVDPSLVAVVNPLCADAEGFRHLRTGVQDMRGRDRVGVLMVTSTSPREGKTTVAVNLAASFAQLEGRALLIDADLRAPKVHELYHLAPEPGLSDLLTGKEHFDRIVRRNVVPNLDILTCGARCSNPAELLASSSMKEYIESLSKDYSVIIVDVPPILAVTDPLLIARMADGVLLVAEAGTITEEALETAMESLVKQRRNILGIVLNNFDAKHAYGGLKTAYKSGYGVYGYPADQGRRRSKVPV